MAGTCGQAGLESMSGGDYLLALHRKAAARGIPLSAGIELTERCNLACVHCYLGDQGALGARRSAELSTHEWRGILDQIAALGCLRLLITGGDPLLRPDFAEVYRHAKGLGLMVTVFTNGTLVDDRMVELFRELPPYSVEVTLYGATEATYERVTRRPGSFVRCMAGVDRLREAGVALGLKTVVLQSNKHELPQIAALAEERGSRRFRCDVEVQGAFGGDRSPLALRLPAEEAVRLELSSPGALAKWKDYIGQRRGLSLAHPDRLYVCSAGEDGIHVNPYGQLQPCLAVRHIGFDLRTGSLGEGIELIRAALAAKKAPPDHACSGCEQRMVCSACPAFALHESGVEEQPARFQCHVTKVRYRLLAQAEGV